MQQSNTRWCLRGSVPFLTWTARICCKICPPPIQFSFPFRFLSPLFEGWGVRVCFGGWGVGWKLFWVIWLSCFFLVLVGSRLTALTNQAQKAKGSQGNTNPFGRGESNITQDFRECSFLLYFSPLSAFRRWPTPHPHFRLWFFFFLCSGVWLCWAIAYHVLYIL